MNRLKTRTILCLSAMTCILLMVPYWSRPGQNQSSEYLQYRDKLDKLKTLAEAKMKIVRDQANQKFLGLGKELDTLSPEQLGAWLRDHRSEETRAAQIWNESATLRNTIYKDYCAERGRLENVYRAGGLGKVGYVFIGDVEYNWERRKLEAWHAGLQNLITLGWLTGNQVSKLEDFEPLIRQKELKLGQKFETIITVYLARGEDLTKALGDSKTAGYVWISHGRNDKRDLLDDNGDPVNADTLRPLVEAAQKRYIMENLPPHLVKLYEETKSSDENVREAASKQLDALKGEDSELYKYVRDEALKVNLGLNYVEHFACLSGADGAQRIVNVLMGEDGVFIGYKGVVDYTGKSGRVTFKGLTSEPTEFKSQNKPDPDPQKTMRDKRARSKPAGDDAALLTVLQRTTKVVLAVYGCRGTKHTEVHYTKKTVETDPPRGESRLLFTATLYPVIWSGSSFSGRSVSAGSDPNEMGTVTVSGSVDTVNRRVTRATASITYRNKEYTNTESVDVTDIPLQSEKMGYFTFVAEKEAFRGKVTGYQRVYEKKGENEPLSEQSAKELGVQAGVKYPFQIKEESGMSDFDFNVAGSAVRISLTPTDLAGNPVKK